jgi:hypothetical protein
MASDLRREALLALEARWAAHNYHPLPIVIACASNAATSANVIASCSAICCLVD